LSSVWFCTVCNECSLQLQLESLLLGQSDSICSINLLCLFTMQLLPSILRWLQLNSALQSASPSCPLDSISCPLKHEPSTNECCVPSPFGVQVIAMQWLPGAFATDALEKMKSFKTADGGYAVERGFTMHGTWPGSCNQVFGGGGSRPPREGCDPTRVLSRKTQLATVIYEKNRPLYENLTRYWPSINAGHVNVQDGGHRANGYFWLHEFNSHGTCLSTIHPKCTGADHSEFEDVFQYFDFGLKALFRFPLLKMLINAGLTPSNRKLVSRSAVIEAFKNGLSALELPKGNGAFRLRFDLICQVNKRTKKQALSEVRLFARVKGNGELRTLLPSTRSDLEASGVTADVRGGCPANFYLLPW
jgi:hypothetical protein